MALTAAAFLSIGAYVNRNMTSIAISAPYSPWVESGDINDVNAAPGVDDMGYATFTSIPDTNCIVWNLGSTQDLPGRKRQFSFEMTSDTNTVTLELYGFPATKNVTLNGDANAVEDAVYLGQLVLTAGTMTGKHSGTYADTCTATDNVWSFNVIDGLGNNRRTVVEVASDKGYRIVYGVATTFTTTKLWAEHRTYQ